MNRYSYKAVNEAGKYFRGKISAQNPAELASLLKSSGYELISYKLQQKGFNLGLFDSVSNKDLVSIFVHLEQLERAGVSILDSIGDLKDTSDSSSIRNLMNEILESIKNGSLFSESLAKHKDIFKDVYIGLIAAGEKTGNLATSFANIIEDLKWNIEIKRKTRKATLGPAFGILMILAVVGVMTTLVVPKVTAFLTMQDIGLPKMTLALIAFSDFFQSYWKVILISISGFYIGMKLFSFSETIAIIIDDIKLRIPIIGPILNKIDAAKFCQFFAITFRSGLGVLECLDASSNVVKNKAIKRSIIMLKQQVSDGQSLAKAISATGYFPNMVMRMFKIGEDSGNMENALQNIKFFYDREINDSIDRLISMIQPALTLVMGGMIGWIALAVFGPIYNSFSKIR